MQELFKRISSQITEKPSSEMYNQSKEYETIPFTKNNFHSIKKEVEKKEKVKLAFIDGGNIEIIGNKNCTFQLMRIYYTIYQDNKKVNCKREDWFVYIELIKAEKVEDENPENKLMYKAKVYQEEKEKESFYFSYEKNNEKIKPEQIINKVRKIYEIRKAWSIINHLEKNDIIIMDGSLKIKGQEEYKEMESLQKATKEKEILLASVTKSSSLVTNTGASLTAYIDSISPQGTWYYYPFVTSLTESHKAESCITKLHEKSEFSFIVDVLNTQKEKLSQLLTQLAYNAKDPIFLGYPYGLIEADRFARCTEEEKNYLKLRFDQYEKLQKVLNSKRAHEILDSVS